MPKAIKWNSLILLNCFDQQENIFIHFYDKNTKYKAIESYQFVFGFLFYILFILLQRNLLKKFMQCKVSTLNNSCYREHDIPGSLTLTALIVALLCSTNLYSISILFKQKIHINISCLIEITFFVFVFISVLFSARSTLIFKF